MWEPAKCVRDRFLELRVFMHWQLLGRHEHWKCKQQELGSLLMQAREHLAEAETEQWHSKEQFNNLKQRTIWSLLHLHVGFPYLRVLIAWRGVTNLISQQRIVDELGKEVAVVRMQAFSARTRMTEVASILWREKCAATLHSAIRCWSETCQLSKLVRELSELQQDNAWYQSRDLAVAGPRLLLPLVRLEAHVALHITFTAWRSFIVDTQNMEAVERILRELQHLKGRMAWQAAPYNPVWSRRLSICTGYLHFYRRKL